MSQNYGQTKRFNTREKGNLSALKLDRSNQAASRWINFSISHFYAIPTKKWVSSGPNSVIVFSFRPNERCLSICINQLQEFVIPISEILKIWVTSFRELAVQVKPNFDKHYLQHPSGRCTQHYPLELDPLNGKLKNASSILFTPTKTVDPSVLWELRCIFESLRPKLLKVNPKSFKNPPQHHQKSHSDSKTLTNWRPVIPNEIHDKGKGKLNYIEKVKPKFLESEKTAVQTASVVKELECGNFEIDQIFVSLKFPTGKHQFFYEKSSTLSEFLSVIKNRFQFNTEYLLCRGPENVVLSVRNEKEWESLIADLEQWKTNKLVVEFDPLIDFN
ncbi:hypothetical protein G9A89_003510 [Geosiphon pyriformis]|nr:hypothetical protein G9A89_003510 [Geosiphon pyriformis]